MGYIILFFIAGPVIIGVGNLILGPIFNKRTPLHVQFRSFIIGSLVYLILATICYFCFFKANYKAIYSLSWFRTMVKLT